MVVGGLECFVDGEGQLDILPFGCKQRGGEGVGAGGGEGEREHRLSVEGQRDETARGLIRQIDFRFDGGGGCRAFQEEDGAAIGPAPLPVLQVVDAGDDLGRGFR